MLRPLQESFFMTGMKVMHIYIYNSREETNRNDICFRLKLIYGNGVLVSGKIPYYSLAPVRNQGEPSEAKIASEFAKEFDIDEVYKSEYSFIGSLKSADDFNPVEIPSSQPLHFDHTMLEVCYHIWSFP